jgi:hypothetical protein
MPNDVVNRITITRMTIDMWMRSPTNPQDALAIMTSKASVAAPTDPIVGKTIPAQPAMDVALKVAAILIDNYFLQNEGLALPAL